VRTMKRKSNHVSFLKRALWKRAKEEKDPTKRRDFRYPHQAACDAEEEIEDMIRDAEMQGIRNPAFPDDLVGWLDDDFDPPDKKTDEDEDDKK
jgi:hypothetical protein